MISQFLSIIILIEILIFCLGGIFLTFHIEEKLSESISQGIFISILIFSFIFQLSFILGYPNFSFILEGITLFFCLFIIKKNLSKSRQILTIIYKFIQQYKIISVIITTVWTYLALQAILLPPANLDSMTYNLARVLLFQQEKSIFLTQVSSVRQAVFPLGSDILHHSFLRFYTDYGIGIFSFLAYLAIAFGTYALARRYASRKYSLIATLIIISLPELVLQSTSTKNDIFTAATAIFCLIICHRIITNIKVKDLLLLPIAISFGVSCKTTFIAFAFPFICCFFLLVLKKYSFLHLSSIIQKNKLKFCLILLPISIFLPILTYLHSHSQFGTWSGPIRMVETFQHADGLKGALANLVRYLFQSMDFLELSNSIPIIGEENISQILLKVYNIIFDPLFDQNGVIGQNGVQQHFNYSIDFMIHEDRSWFGPLGFLIVIPSIFYCLIKGNLFLSGLALNLLIYSFIVSYKIVWMPPNNRFFTLFFASSGVLVAYVLQQLKLKHIVLKIITLLSIFILIYAATFNTNKPFKSIWSQTKFGTNRTYYSDIADYPNVNIISQFIPNNSEVALVTGFNTWVYYYLLYNSNIRIIPFNDRDPNLVQNLSKFDYIFYLDSTYNPDINLGDSKILWSSDKRKGSKLVQVN
ncbi:MAG: glycosyltransferase family 39 protein [Xenococcus sp. MO_188.B8]|nr:glycosyltransferase family 39 protein [Xenococcus sp. MO_188.B8]